MSELALSRPDSKRMISSIARINYLHSRHIRTGKIINSDLLFTLSLFALEAGRWVEKHEWRSLTDLELCACGTFWKSIGDAMEISYIDLPSSKPGWKDGLHWLEELKDWSLWYEEKFMIPATPNNQLANAYLDLLFVGMPTWLSKMGRTVVTVLTEPRLRTAMMYTDLFNLFPPLFFLVDTHLRLPQVSGRSVRIVNGILTLRRYFVKYLTLPRPEMLRKQYISSSPPSSTGRYNAVDYISDPWYVRPSFGRRWGPWAWLARLLGYKLPGDDGNKFEPEGYLIHEVGPANLKGRGIIEMKGTEARLSHQGIGGCPFAFG